HLHTTMFTFHRLALTGLAACAMLACGGQQDEPKTSADCRNSAGDDIEMAAKTTGKAVETGAVAAYHGVKTVGESGVGWVKGGSREARKEWNEEADETDRVTHERAAETRQAANTPECPK
ncbi:MAG: hypothetical protein KC766_24775, partial [Myxococcales bacterium]|nr:hypothetical protein [Myxococcales bacterium]